jgi:hypothetical protein
METVYLNYALVGKSFRIKGSTLQNYFPANSPKKFPVIWLKANELKLIGRSSFFFTSFFPHKPMLFVFE